MSPEQIQQVRDSFARVQPIAGEAAALFYAKLFAADMGSAGKRAADWLAKVAAFLAG